MRTPNIFAFIHYYPHELESILNWNLSEIVFFHQLWLLRNFNENKAHNDSLRISSIHLNCRNFGWRLQTSKELRRRNFHYNKKPSLWISWHFKFFPTHSQVFFILFFRLLCEQSDAKFEGKKSIILSSQNVPMALLWSHVYFYKIYENYFLMNSKSLALWFKFAMLQRTSSNFLLQRISLNYFLRQNLTMNGISWSD